jgi:hypothetical protein
MKTRTLLSALIAATLGAGAAVAASEGTTAEDPKIAEAKTIIQEFATRLVGELGDAIQAGGPVAAIEVCRDRAPAIADELSAATGWAVARTSLKTRNVETNAPDAWETTILEQFNARQEAGEDVQKMAHAEVIEDENGKRFRFMKAIPTAELCLNCHGSDIKPEVIEALDEVYPHDQARGYEIGQVRGAFSLEKPL